MTIVLVHGNPETEAVWDDLLPHLRDDDIVRLSPPGYGTPIPQGFDCSVDAYRDWLASELKKLAQPIDLVGHDWGGGHVVRIAMDCPTLIRSWTSDALGAFDKDYVWHDLAQVWQTPEAGEQAVQQMLSTPSEARAQRYETLGITPAIAQKVAAGTDRDMGRAILTLYSADRDGRYLWRWAKARAPFCRARRCQDSRLERGGTLVDVPTTKTGC
jgi:pimeloyl-ACP methyl ester carboxylesterase